MPFPGFPLFLRLFPDFPALSAKKSPCFTAFLNWKQGDCSFFIYFSALRLDQTVGVVLSLVNDVYFVGLCIAEYEEGVSKKFHLYAGIFRIHWFHAEFFRTDDLDVFVLQIVMLQIFFLEVSCFLLFVGNFVFVFAKLAFDDLLYQIDGYVHIVAYLLGTDDISFYRNGNLNFLSFFLYT